MTRITCNTTHDRGTGGPKAWLKLFGGACVITGMAILFGSGLTPPGICGEVVRHNQQADIDASPFFYGDVDNILDLIEGAERLYYKTGTDSNKKSIDTVNAHTIQEDF